MMFWLLYTKKETKKEEKSKDFQKSLSNFLSKYKEKPGTQGLVEPSKEFKEKIKILFEEEDPR